MKRHEPIPRGFAVRPLKAGQKAKERATCGHCGLSWDDGKVTSITPAPAGRCPFEEFHIHEDDAGDGSGGPGQNDPLSFASLSWTAADVQSLAAGLSDEQAADWLSSNERHLRDRLCELGWGVMESLLSADGIELESGDDLEYRLSQEADAKDEADESPLDRT